MVGLTGLLSKHFFKCLHVHCTIGFADRHTLVCLSFVVKPASRRFEPTANAVQQKKSCHKGRFFLLVGLTGLKPTQLKAYLTTSFRLFPVKTLLNVIHNNKARVIKSYRTLLSTAHTIDDFASQFGCVPARGRKAVCGF